MKEPSISDRWFGAVCYLSILVVIPIFVKNKSEFLARHCRQGFALLFAEVVVIVLLSIIEATIGRIPILGALISILLHLVFFLAFLALSVIGFVKALSGEGWRLPYLDEFSHRVPIHASSSPESEST
jgi:uncharacterized membrane protein